MGKIINGIFNNGQSGAKVSAVIAAAGKGERMGLDFNKIFLSVEDKPIISYTLDVFEDCPLVEEIIISAKEEDIPLLNDIINDFEYKKVKTIVRGGKTRQESILNALDAVAEHIKTIAVHDGARPLLPPSVLHNTILKGIETGAAATGIMAKDTLKTIDTSGNISDTVDRSKTALIQTPQVFDKELLIKAHKYAKDNNINATDDCALLEQTGKKVSFVAGSSLNIKLTTPEDYLFISSYLQLRGEV